MHNTRGHKRTVEEMPIVNETNKRFKFESDIINIPFRRLHEKPTIISMTRNEYNELQRQPRTEIYNILSELSDLNKQ